jgi:hypothetical protein
MCVCFCIWWGIHVCGVRACACVFVCIHVCVFVFVSVFVRVATLVLTSLKLATPVSKHSHVPHNQITIDALL